MVESIVLRASTKLIPLTAEDGNGRDILEEDIRSNNTPIVIAKKKIGPLTPGQKSVKRRTDLSNFRLRQGLIIAGNERKEVGPAYDFNITFGAGSLIARYLAEGWLFLPIWMAEHAKSKVDIVTDRRLITPERNDQQHIFSVNWLTNERLVEPHVT